ncbi:MAG TPA: hydrophobic protein [Streptosporangiaceae bacterium]|nr:hydrophobic protein [Streptosporangiaceae bacterium]
MMVILLVLLLAVVLAGLGFAVHLLWWLALVVLAIWLVGFLFRATESAARPRRRWYRW